MKKTYLLLLIFALTVTMCSDSKLPNYEPLEFKETINREISFNEDNPILGVINYMEIIDSMLIIKAENSLNSKKFHLFSKGNLEHIMSFGDIGKAKGELLEPFSLISSANNNIYATGIRQKKIVKFDLAALATGNEYISETVLPSVVKSMFLHNLGDNRYLSAYDGKNRFVILPNLSDSAKNSYNKFPITSDFDKEKEQLRSDYFSYKSQMTVSPDKKRFANATSGGLIMEIFEINKSKIKLEKINYFYKPEFSSDDVMMGMGECANGAYSLKSTDKNIYMIYCDKTERALPFKIGVFDWKGKPLREYVVNYPIFNMAVDEEGRKIYVAAIVDDNFIIGHIEL